MRACVDVEVMNTVCDCISYCNMYKEGHNMLAVSQVLGIWPIYVTAAPRCAAGNAEKKSVE